MAVGTQDAEHGASPGGVAPAKPGTQMQRATHDVAKLRERARQRRLATLGAILAPVAVWLWWPVMFGGSLPWPDFPEIDPFLIIVFIFFVLMFAVLIGTTVVAGRSPHVTYTPEQISTKFEDVKGVGPLKEEVERSLELFLTGRTFRSEMGGTPRRGLLFEGTPGTGKTLMAKAMAKEAGVPFLFVSGTSFQSMYYGATARKIRSFFKAVRKQARAEGGCIAFIEEIDAIAMTRGGMNSMSAHPMSAHPMSSHPASTHAMEHNRAGMNSEGVGGVVNELLVQMQSFDSPTGLQKVQAVFSDAINRFLPPHRQIPRPRLEAEDVLIIAATNRADNLDPALLRPGRFDRRLTFDVPDKSGRRELVDYFLAKKSHTSELDEEDYRDALASITNGYSPAQLENLLDEGLIGAVRRGAGAMTWKDIEQARMLIEVGVGKPVGYSDHEQRLIATHEAGHAVMAHLESPERRLEILTIIKRGQALGLLAHGDPHDVYTRSNSELTAMIRIALGGYVAEELFFGQTSTGPGSDLAHATGIAAQMLGASGMGDSLVSFGAVESGFGGGNLVAKVLGDGQMREAVEQLLAAQHQHVRSVMDSHRYLVVALRDALLERHELIGVEITDVLREAQKAFDDEVGVIDLTGVEDITPALPEDDGH